MTRSARSTSSKPWARPWCPPTSSMIRTAQREWIAAAEFSEGLQAPVGSSSSNVRLVKTREEAYRLCNQAFSAGFKPVAG